MERSLVLIKPDAMQRGLAGTIISRLQGEGLKLVALKMLHMDRALAERHYAPHKSKAFYPGLLDYITGGPAIVMVLQGERAIEIARTLMGKTFGYEAAPGTIRGDFGASRTYNLAHGSDSPETAETEIALYFSHDDLLQYSPAGNEWVFRPDER